MDEVIAHSFDKKIKRKKKPVQKRLLEALSCVDKPIRKVSLSEFVSSPYTICRQLEKAGLIKTIFQPKIMNPFDIMGSERKKNIQLSEVQEEVVNRVQYSINGFHPYLLHGVTGSGKTEVYLRLAQSTVEFGKSVLVLVPEISLTPQVSTRFRKAFGDNVALWHSIMTKTEKG